MTTTTPDTENDVTSAQERERVVRGVVDRWKSAVDAHEPQRVADLFTEDAIFQGLHPYGVGREAVAEYYASQPIGLEAAYEVVESRRFGEDAILAYLSVEFTFTDRPALDVHLSMLLTRAAEGWLIAHYQVSKLG
jgi:uncharacterized protein (TIGR02246 family)